MDIVFAKDKKKNKNKFVELSKRLFEKIKHHKLSNSFYYFLILFAISIGFYMIMLATNGFILNYSGDYSSQYIPMGYHVWDLYHNWFKTGHFALFDTSIYLGVNSLGSNSYYGLFSPFNIIIILLPRSFTVYSIAICSFTKLSCAGLFFSIYMKRAFKIKENISFICGIAYAFCGWSAFYIWYNNYQDVLVFFPLILLGIERTIQEQKPWVLAIGVFFLTICNYVLMVPYIICAFIYAMFRFFQTIRTRNIQNNFKVLGLGILGFGGGLLMGLFVLAPAFMATLSSPKLDDNSYADLLKGYLENKDYTNFVKSLFSWKAIGDQHGNVIPDRVFYPILEFFFPTTTCRSLPMLELSDWDFDDIAVSLWCYVPMILFLVPSLIQSGKEKKFSHYIAFVFIVVSLFTPFMYFVTMGFTNGYARWTLFIASSLIAYVGIYLDKIPNVARWHMHFGYAFAIAGIITAWILTYKLNGDKCFQYMSDGSLTEYRHFILRFDKNGGNFTNIAFILELIYVTGVYIALFFLYNKKKAFSIVATAFVAVEAIAVGNFVTKGHGSDIHYNNGYSENIRYKQLIDSIKKTDKSFYRISAFFNDGYSENNGIMNDYGSANYFHSLYNYEVSDFTLWTGLRNNEKSVGGNYYGKYQDVDNFLGIKYYIVNKNQSEYYNIEKMSKGSYIANVPYDFEERKDLETDEWKVYENKNINALGYAYSSLCNAKSPLMSSRSITSIYNAVKLAKRAVVSPEDGEEINKLYSDIELAETMPTSNIKSMSEGVHFARTFYDIWEAKHTWACNLPFEEVPTIDITYTPVKYSPNTSSENYKNPMDYYAVLKSPTEGQPLFKSGTTIYAKANFWYDQKYRFYFIDQDNHVVMYDMHHDETTNNTNSMRGFYVKKDIYKLAICPVYGNSFLTENTGNGFSLYYETEDDYRTRWNIIDTDKITDVTYTTDKFTFKTKFGGSKFVVTHVAYDNGWKIKATNNVTKKTSNVKLYKGNGAFVSFVAQEGDYSYTMVYETPYLKISYIVSAFSFGGFFLSMLAYHCYQENKRKRHLDQLFREN